MIDSIYDKIYSAVCSLILILRPLLSKKTQAWIALRENKNIFTTSLQLRPKRVWIHASSGEIEYAKSVIREMKSHNKDIQIFVSYSSLSAPRLFKNIENEVDYFFPLNWDTTTDNSRLLDWIQPQVLIFSRTDFWLNLIRQSRLRGVQLNAISVFPTLNLVSRFWLSHVLKDFKFISCATDETAAHLQAILPKVIVESIPDTRFDQVFHRLTQPSKLAVPTGMTLATFGSTWPKDDTILLSTVAYFKTHQIGLIWAPHEVAHTEELINKINQLKLNLKIIRLSKCEDHAVTERFDILIIDLIGYLADAYRFSKVAFVGGSFVKKVHSVMEPLCAQNIVFVGPHYNNNPEALHFMKKDLVHVIHSGSDLLNYLPRIFSGSAHFEKLKTETQKMAGGTKRTSIFIIEKNKI